tara:strand:- start:392 stop:700 length:309 start_codon:yes stop_codon:yes gene_type:complete
MTIKETIIAVVKKIRCKCKCFGGIELELKGSNTPPNTPVENIEFDNTNNNTNNLSIENNVNLSPTPSPVVRRSPAPLPRPPGSTPPAPPPRVLPTHDYVAVF